MEGFVKSLCIEAHTEEWVMARLGKFSSSEIKRLGPGRGKNDYFGEGAFTYINEKVAEILTGIPKELARGLPALDWGVAHEPEAADLYSLKTNQKLLHSGFYEYSIVFGGTPDREIEGNSKLIIEIKCPYVSSNFIEVCKINSGEELLNWDKAKFLQCQGNMLVTGAEMCDLVYYDPRIRNVDYRLKIIRIYRDESMIKNEIIDRTEAAAEIMSQDIEHILNMDQRNLQYRIAG